MNQQLIFSDRINLAIRRCAATHDGQYRKNSTTPYAAHPFAVACMTQNYLLDENLFIAALFHDILEDVPARVYSAENIRAEFGEDVLKIVESVTEIRGEGNAKDLKTLWRTTKENYLKNLASLDDPRPLILSACDKIHNISDLLHDYEQSHGKIMEFFFSDKNQQFWFYQAVYDVLKTKNLPPELLEKYTQKISQFKEKILA